MGTLQDGLRESVFAASGLGFREVGALAGTVDVVAAVASLAADIGLAGGEQRHMPGEDQVHRATNAGGIGSAVVARHGFEGTVANGLLKGGEMW